MYTLTATTRVAKGVPTRSASQVPAVIYGAGGKAESLTLNPAEFLKLYKQAGGSSLIDLSVDGKEVGKVLIQEIQSDPVKDRIIHVDLRRIDMNKAMTAPVVLKFVGESPIIKSSGGTLVTSVQSVEVRCLPKDLVSHIDINLASLVSYDNVIKVKDLQLPAGIEVINPQADDLVVKAAPALTEEQIKAMEEAAAPVDLSKIESAGKKKEEEGEEGAEGPAAGAEAKDAKAAPDKKAPEEKKEKK